MINVFRYKTPEGFDDLLMYTDGKTLTGLLFAGSYSETNVEETCRGASLPPIIRDTCRWLDVYFTGRQPDFTPACHMEGLTSFRKAVLDVVSQIPFGTTMTYGEIAKRLKVNSAQAVGGAVGWNPVCLVVPCHRVLGANGKLIGYGGGLRNKIALLELEEATVVSANQFNEKPYFCTL